jgi:hypothetical protein
VEPHFINNFLEQNMRIAKTFLLATLITIFMVGLYSCDNLPTSGDGPIESIGLAGSDYTIPDLDNSQSTLIDATIDSDFQLVEPEVYGLNGNGEGNGKGKGQKRGYKMRKRMHDPFRTIMGELDLNEDQMTKLKGIVELHQNCIKDILMALRETEKELLGDLRIQREELVAQFKNGELERDAFVTAMRELNQQAREMLQNNPARIDACYKLNECRQAFFDAIAEMLTPEQLVIWQQWLEDHPLRKCEEEETEG